MAEVPRRAVGPVRPEWPPSWAHLNSPVRLVLTTAFPPLHTIPPLGWEG